MLTKLYEKDNNGLFYCDVYNRIGWIWMPNYKRGNSKTGKSFPIRKPEQCIDFDDFISQFIIQKSGKYYRVSHEYFGGRQYLHHVCWKFHNNWGEIPKGMYIDHIDGDKYNNVIDNLRLVSPSQSIQNRNLSHNLPKGVSFNKEKGKYVARYRKKYLGYFDSIKKAEEKVINAAKLDKTYEFWRK